MTPTQEADSALARFEADADRLIEDVIKRIVVTKVTPHKIVHYTDDKGLRGILESGNLWFTDIFHLNDPSELRHGCSFAAEHLNQLADRGGPDEREFAQKFGNFVRYGAPRSAKYFVCAFSADYDDLGQWRAYADDGRGYALEFDGAILEGKFAKNADGSANAHNSTFAITYEEGDLSAAHKALIDDALPLVGLPRKLSLNTADRNDFLKRLSVALSLRVLRSALFFKHHAYFAEQEFRFMQLYAADENPPNLQMRYRSHEMVKYLAFDWRGVCPDALKSIKVGPASDKQRSIRFARECLQAFQPTRVEIVASAIPYRSVGRES